ncbi:MAG: hypothetical protein IPL61_14085 [Myxococcales bacterium]|nr:hypothetical protein [Myxococcales bacterium]
MLMSLRLVSMVSCALLAACGGKAAGPAAPSPASSAAAAGPTGVLKALENGDRACYVVLEDAAGEQSLEGDFDLCEGGPHDATALIGQRVTVTTRKANVLAASCEGDMDCGKSDEVDLVETITPAP